MTSNSKVEFRRYTDLGSALDMVLKKRLVLLSPQSWDDHNDSHFLETYRVRRKLGAVRVLCLSMREETYHHWKVYGPGATGVCIVFHRQPFLDFVQRKKSLRGGIVQYKSLAALRKLTTLPDEELPFLKRAGYGDEGEYRVILESKRSCEDAHPVAMPLDLIQRIVLSPWTPRPVYRSVRRIFRTIELPEGIDIRRSTITNTEMWKDRAAELQALADSAIP